MTIKQQGGIFGRNPTFNEVDATDITTESLSLLKNNPFVRLDDSDTDNNGEFRLDNTSVRIEADKDNAVSGSKIKFKIDNSEIGFFDENGNLDIDGNLVVASGQGIDFSATSGTGTSELFDDYEEGTWSITELTSGTESNQYVKVGSLVTCTAAVSSGVFSSNTLTGLPFTQSSYGSAAAVYNVGYGPGSGEVLNAQIFSSSIILRSYDQGTGSFTNLADLTGSTFNLCFSYRAA